MRFKLLILIAVAAVAVVLSAVIVLTTRGGREFAPVRAYAGFIIDSQGFDGTGSPAVVARVGAPADRAGLRQFDVVAKVGGVSVTNGYEVYVEIEKRQPGDSVEIEVDRYDFRRAVPNTPLPEPERLTLKLDLVEEPQPDTSAFWVPYTGVKLEDQLRLGMFLSDVTVPLAQRFGIEGPGGVLIRFQPLLAWVDKGLEEGDVIKSFDGKTVMSLKQLQGLVDKTPEDKAIKIGVQRGKQTLEFTLDSLGPNVPGANQLPGMARQRLHAALERGDLHPDHVQGVASSYRRTDPTPGESHVRAGTIKKLSESSITIELYETGTEWTLAIDPSTIVAGYGARGGLVDLNVGEFVDLFSRGETASHIYSKQAPLTPP